MSRPARMTAKLWATMHVAVVNAAWRAPRASREELACIVCESDPAMPEWSAVAIWLSKPTQASADARHWLEHGETRKVSERLAAYRQREAEERETELREIEADRRKFAGLRSAAARGDRGALRKVAASAPAPVVVMPPLNAEERQRVEERSAARLKDYNSRRPA